MTLGNVIEGLMIFRKYFRGQDGYHLGAEHDVIRVFPTHTPMSEADVEAVQDLGWFQPDAECPDDVDIRDAPYDPDEYWQAYV